MSDMRSVPYFSEEDLAKLDITIAEVVDLIEKLIRDCEASRVWSAPKASISVPDGRYIMSTLAVADDPPFLACKSLLLNPRNPESGEPLMNSIVVLQDGKSGRPVAILDGNWITAVRTAALSVLAAKRLAKPTARVIAFIGSGVQARSHLSAMADSFPLTEVRIFGRGRANIDRLCEHAATLGLVSSVADTPEDALRGADLIVSSVTRSHDQQPFVDASAVEPGACACLTDLAKPWLPKSLSGFDCIVIDDKSQEAAMKDQMVQPELVSGDLTDLVLDRVNSNAAAGARCAFIFRGFALGDFALAAHAYQVAVATS
ncbi:MAG: ornithine cyclodeaminase family protein [Hyphomicrobiaceae bacterium]